MGIEGGKGIGLRSRIGKSRTPFLKDIWMSRIISNETDVPYTSSTELPGMHRDMEQRHTTKAWTHEKI